MRLLIVPTGPAQVTGVSLHTWALGAKEWVAPPEGPGRSYGLTVA
ncbi:MAG: hypothetical protein AAB225_07285 [Acidobacteriota bacterium]